MHFNLDTSQAMSLATQAPRRRAPWIQLLSALMKLADGKAELVRHREQSWASVTFSGTRHNVVLGFTGPEPIAAGENLIALVPEHEFALPGQLVADAAVIRVDQQHLPEARLELELELLLLDEA